MQVIGLTGGIASGKSLVNEILRDEYDATIISGDELGHQAYLPDTDAWKDVLARWGEDLMNPESREIDRRKLGGIVFADPEELKALNEIMWPRIRTSGREPHQSNCVRVAPRSPSWRPPS